MKIDVVQEVDYESMYTSIQPDKMYNLSGQKILDLIQQELYRILDKIPASVFWKNEKGEMLGCNQYLVDMAQCGSRAALIGTKDYDFLTPEAADALRAIDQQVMQHQTTICIEEKVVMPGVENDRVFFSAKQPLTSGEKIIGIIGVSIDITKQKSAESKAESANVISGTVAHDIKNQIFVNNLLAESELNLLDQAQEAAEISESLALKLSENKYKILEQNQKILDNINSSTNLLKNELQENPEEDSFDGYPISRILQEVKKVWENQGKSHLIYDEVEDFDFWGDELWVEKILMNLIDNALRQIDLRGKGAIYFSQVADDNYTYLKVKDTAGGITEQYAEGIFELFRQGKVQNTVFGLASARIFMQRMKGELRAGVVDGDCIEFTLCFPKVKMDCFF